MKTTDEDLNQFTFFRSYYEAIEDLPEKVQLNVLKAIIEYALYGKEIAVSGTAKVAFTLSKPTLDKMRAKALNGRKGGTSEREANAKQSESKTEAKAKQSESTSEFALYKDKDKEKDKEMDIYKDKEVIYKLPIGG